MYEIACSLQEHISLPCSTRNKRCNTLNRLHALLTPLIALKLIIQPDQNTWCQPLYIIYHCSSVRAADVIFALTPEIPIYKTSRIHLVKIHRVKVCKVTMFLN